MTPGNDSVIEVAWITFINDSIQYGNLCPNQLEMERESKADDPDQPYLPLFEFVINFILLVGVALPGLVGNFISVFILSRPQMRTSLNVILIGLATFDSILLVTSILLFALPAIYSYTALGVFYHRHIYPRITPYVFLLGTTSQTSSVYLTVGVTVERYIAVCHPLRARYWCTCRRGRIAVVFIGLLSFLYNLPRFFEVDHCIHIDFIENTSWPLLKPSPLRSNNEYISWYIVCLYFVVMNFVPFTLLAILNTAIYKQVRKANRERALLTNFQKREIGLATMLLCVVAVFFIFNTMAMVVNIFEKANILVNEMTCVSNLLVSVNSSVNFIIYCIFGDKFKRLFLHYFCGKRWMTVSSRASGRSSPVDVHENSVVSTNFSATLCRTDSSSGRIFSMRSYAAFAANGRCLNASHREPRRGADVPCNSMQTHSTSPSMTTPSCPSVPEHQRRMTFHRHPDVHAIGKP